MPILALDQHAPVFADPGGGFVAPDAQVIGRVEVGRDASIWFGAVLRGDADRIVLGEGSNVQDGAVLHADPGCPCLVGAHVTVGHRAVVHGAVVGEGSLIGMGAILLNRVAVGRDCLVGAGALLTENRRFPDGSLILGSPARVVRALTDAEIAALRASAERYVGNARRFRDGLRPAPSAPI